MRRWRQAKPLKSPGHISKSRATHFETRKSEMTNYSSFQLQDKIAIVTGPSQGIGRAIAIGLAQAGAHLVLAGRPGNQEAIKLVQAEIEKLGRKALLVPTDVSDISQIRTMIDKAKTTFGRI